MTRREENLVEIIGALFRLHADGKHETLAAAMKTAEVLLLNPSPIQCEGVALDLLKLSPRPTSQWPPDVHVVDGITFVKPSLLIAPIERPIAPPYVHHPKKDPDR